MTGLARTALTAAQDADEFGKSLRAAYGVFDTQPLSHNRHITASGAVRPVHSAVMEGFEIYASAISSVRPPLEGEWERSAFLLMVLDGSVSVQHYGRSAALSKGDMVLLDAHEGCRLDVFDKAHAVTLSLPRASVLALRPAAPQLFALQISSQRVVSRVLSSTVMAAIAEDCRTAAEIDAIRGAVLTLLDEALSRGAASQYSSADAAILERMREWVIRMSQYTAPDPDLMAADFGKSRRSLYRMFDRMDTTPMRWISDVRLDHAYKMLKNTREKQYSIREVAFAAGFKDSSHFARMFRRRFGIAPRACRTEGASLCKSPACQ